MTLIVEALLTLIIANLIILCNRHVTGAERIHEQYPWIMINTRHEL